MAETRRIMVALSGASGMVYAKRLIEVLPSAYETIYLTASDNAVAIAQQELGIGSLAEMLPQQTEADLRLLESDDMFAPPASGSHEYDGMVIVPCSMGVVGRIAAGVSNDLTTRAADVCLKERRKLILVVRETPYNLIQLRNMTALTEAGAVILPASPAFYNKPGLIGDLVDFVVDRILRLLGTDIRLGEGWDE